MCQNIPPLSCQTRTQSSRARYSPRLLAFPTCSVHLPLPVKNLSDSYFRTGIVSAFRDRCRDPK
ncbi:hypothetical protein PGB90_000880 [Kerria lacca]